MARFEIIAYKTSWYSAVVDAESYEQACEIANRDFEELPFDEDMDGELELSDVIGLD